MSGKGSADGHPLTDEIWQAIMANDASYDGTFFYAVTTTGIFCRPSCQSRPPKKGNVRIFCSAAGAMSAQFRPCKRCNPTGGRPPDHEWVDQITNCIDTKYSERLTLETIAAICHGSPYHVHRTFKRLKGVTLVEYLRHVRMNKAMECLSRSDRPIAEVALRVGLPSTPYFITMFKMHTGYTPAQFRRLYRNSGKEVLPSGSKP